MRNPHFFQKCCHFCWLCFDFSKNDNTFERNEDCATVFLKWTDFRREMEGNHPICAKIGHQLCTFPYETDRSLQIEDQFFSWFGYKTIVPLLFLFNMKIQGFFEHYFFFLFIRNARSKNRHWRPCFFGSWVFSLGVQF